MIIREQLERLIAEQVEFVVVGGQAGVLRQAVEFSHDLDVLIRPTSTNAERVVRTVRAISGVETNTATVLGRDFQQYIDEQSRVRSGHRPAIAFARHRLRRRP